MVPRTEEQYEEIRLQSRTAIMHAALELFARYGFHNTSISKIADEAGVSKGLIYNYFASKEQLLQAILEEAIKIGDDILAEENQKERDQFLTGTLHRIFEMIKNRSHYWKLILALSMHEDVVRQFQHLIKPQQDRSLKILEGYLARKRVHKPRLQALALSALLDGILLQYIYMGDQYPIEDMEAFLVEEIHKFEIKLNKP